MTEENKHECMRKIGPIWEVRTDPFGQSFCCSCGAKLTEDQIEPRVMREMQNKRRRN